MALRSSHPCRLRHGVSLTFLRSILRACSPLRLGKGCSNWISSMPAMRRVFRLRPILVINPPIGSLVDGESAWNSVLNDIMIKVRATKEGHQAIAGSTFQTNPFDVEKLLEDCHHGVLQLPDFQRSWVWDEDRIKSLIASISRAFPVGALMTLNSGGPVNFKPRPVEGAPIEAKQTIPQAVSRAISLVSVATDSKRIGVSSHRSVS